MSEQRCHVEQARHNESVAAVLLKAGKFPDWVATTAFYAAVHYVEAGLAIVPGVGHSESSLPIDPVTKQTTYTLHNWREELVRRHFPKAFRSYKYLRTTSNHARYLKGNNKPAFTYFSRTDAESFVNNHLAAVKGAVRVV